MNKRTLFELYNKLNSVLGFANVNCLSAKCNFCETEIDHAFLFPFEDEYLNNRTGKAIPSDNSVFNGLAIKKLGVSKNGLCGFFRNNKCIIQDLKPIECKLYPLIIWTEKGVVSLELDLRCPEAVKLRKNKEYIRQILPHLKVLAEYLPSEYFIAREVLPDEMGKDLRKLKIATLRKITEC